MRRSPRTGEDGPRELGPIERVALFVCAVRKDEVETLLAGLADGPGRRARSFAQQVSRWDSSTRQARLAREFGAAVAPVEQLQRLIVESPPRLRVAIHAQLPESLKAFFPHLGSSAVTSPAMAAIAARLVREATSL